LGLATFNRQNPSICTNSNCGKATAASNQDILSQDIEEAVVIKQTKKHNLQKKRRRKRLNKTQRKSTTFKKAPHAHSILNGPKSNGKAKGGEGNDNIAGDKGSLNGPYANSYYGSGNGTGNGSGWGLNGRSISSRGKRYRNVMNLALS
jgi:hypothetical protein